MLCAVVLVFCLLFVHFLALVTGAVDVIMGSGLGDLSKIHPDQNIICPDSVKLQSYIATS